MSVPLHGDHARRLLGIVAFAGAERIVFAGGDPSLRRDLDDLCRLAKSLRLGVEIQTNGDIHTPTVLRAIDSADSLALSIDAGFAQTHDAVRGRAGNYERNVRLAAYAVSHGVSTRVRSLVTQETAPSLQALGATLSEIGVSSWDLQELAPVGLGLTTTQERISAELIEELAAKLAKDFPDIHIRTNSSANKKGLYAMVRSDGLLYGTAGDVDASGYYPTLGDLMSDHVAPLASMLSFRPKAHLERYGEGKTKP